MNLTAPRNKKANKSLQKQEFEIKKQTSPRDTLKGALRREVCFCYLNCRDRDIVFSIRAKKVRLLESIKRKGAFQTAESLARHFDEAFLFCP